MRENENENEARRGWLSGNIGLSGAYTGPETNIPLWGRLSLSLGATLCICFALVAIYVAGIALFDEGLLRGGAVGLAGVVILLVEPLALKYPGAPKHIKGVLWAIDFLLLIGFVFSIRVFLTVYEDLFDGVRLFEDWEMAVAALGVVVIIELTRRTFGPVLALICVLVLGYALLGPDLPWIFRHAGNSWDEVLGTVWYSFDGVFGTPAGIVATIVLVFIAFGAVLEGTGAAEILIKIAVYLTARLRGGSAHSAIVASALFGTISGSTVANVVGTGVFTIPLIKRQGFSNSFAGAVEAAASSGGQFTPPIMAAVVFLMAEIIGVPYLTICAAAALPALFYYGSLFATVYAEAVRQGIEPLPEDQRPVVTRDDWIQSLRFIIPIIVVVSVLFAGRSPALAGFWALISAPFVALILNLRIVLDPEFWRNPQRMITPLVRAGHGCARIMIAVGAVGIVIAVVNTTGLGVNFAQQIASLAEGTLWLALALTMLACLVLGMGLPTLPAYLIIALVMGPAIAKLGINILLVHLFLLYYGVLSNITPPVAIAAYAAAPIAQSNPMTTGVQAVRLAAVGFAIPFVLIYNPSLSLVIGFEWGAFLWLMIRLPIAIWLIATGTTGYEVARLSLADRVLRVLAGFLCLSVAEIIAIPAFAIGGGLILWHRIGRRTAAPVASG